MAEYASRITKDSILVAIIANIIFLPMAAVPAYLAIGAVREWRNVVQIQKEGEVVSGVITDKTAKPPPGRPGRRGVDYVETLQYMYRTKAGVEFSDSVTVEEDVYRNHQIGQNITLLVDPDNPSINVPKFALDKNRVLEVMWLAIPAAILSFIAISVLCSTVMYFAGWVGSDAIITFFTFGLYRG